MRLRGDAQTGSVNYARRRLTSTVDSLDVRSTQSSTASPLRFKMRIALIARLRAAIAQVHVAKSSFEGLHARCRRRSSTDRRRGAPMRDSALH